MKLRTKPKPKSNLKTLGVSRAKFTGLETFPRPANTDRVICVSDEVTALCPVTGQPDWYVVEVDYQPDKLCVESKTLKLYLQSFRNTGHFCEKFASILCDGLYDALRPHAVTVTVTQKPRGGVSIKSSASRYRP